MEKKLQERETSSRETLRDFSVCQEEPQPQNEKLSTTQQEFEPSQKKYLRFFPYAASDSRDALAAYFRDIFEGIASPVEVIFHILIAFELQNDEYIIASYNGVGLPLELAWRKAWSLRLKLVNIWRTR